MPRSCTCHPDDNPPVPCAEQYAYSDCVSQPRRRRYSYDQACADLAFYFLTDGKRDTDPDAEPVKELAQAIQDLCEDYCRTTEQKG